MAQYTPFPTFGGPKEGGGIMNVKLSPTQMRFPTARGPARRAPEPDTLEKIAPLLPFLFDGIGSMIKGKPETMTDTQYLDSIGGLSSGTTLEDELSNKKKLAQLQTYQQFGTPEKKDGFGFDDIFDIVAASQLGRGASSFAKNTVAVNRAKEQDRLTKATNRAAFTKEALKDINNLQYKVFEDVDKARAGVSDYRSGFVDPRGDIYVMKDDKSGYANIKELKGNWIEQQYKPTQSLSTQMKDPRYTDLSKKDLLLQEKDTALQSTVTLINDVVSMLDKGIADPTQNPLTLVTSIGNFLNNAQSNAESALSYVGNGSVSRAFATVADLNDNVGGSRGREGTGENAKILYQAIQSGDDEQMIAAMEAFEQSEAGKAYGTNFRASLGDMAYNNVQTRAVMLQLAYSAAATAGQTGRTLSDKDLAFFLQIVGFGATQDAQTAKDNLLSFGDRTVRQTDNVIQTEISQNRLIAGQYPLDDKLFTSLIAGYWDAPKDENGNPNFLDPENYEFKNFYKRYGKIPDVVKYQTHKRRAGTEFNPNQGTTLVNPSTKLEEDLKAIENLY